MKFSFVLLTWNRPQFLERCLYSLTASIANPAECEIVVMDNGSTDRTHEILDEYAKRPNVRVIKLRKNYGIKAYRKLFRKACGEYIVVVDDDVLEFPPRVEEIFESYMQAFPDYGFLSLNVVQDEFTNGAKPGPEAFTADTRGDKVVEEGPAGGWCACFRKRNLSRLWLRWLIFPLNMRTGEDGFIVRHFREQLNLRAGVIRDAVCFHASGPYYAAHFGHLDREIEKYAMADMPKFVQDYESYRDKAVVKSEGDARQ